MSPVGWGSRLGHASPPLLVAALGLEVLSLVATAELQRRLLSGGGIRARLASLLAMVWAGNAVSAAVPAGAVASTVYGYRQLTRRGAPSALAGWLLVATGALSAAALALVAVVGVQLRGLLSTCTVEDVAEVTALVGVVVGSVWVLAWASGRPGRLAVMERALKRVGERCAPRLPTSLRRSRADASTARDQPVPSFALPGCQWVAVASLAVVNWAADAAVLAVSVVAVGAHLPWRGLVLAYALSQVATSLPLLPGSLGVAEGSLAVGLVCAGLAAPDALAATLTYRLASFWLQLPAGWAAWAWLRRPTPFQAAPIGDVA